MDYTGVSPVGFSSGWINAPTWRVNVGGQNAAVKFRVKARDAYGNETGWSDYGGGHRADSRCYEPPAHTTGGGYVREPSLAAAKGP